MTHRRYRRRRMLSRREQRQLRAVVIAVALVVFLGGLVHHPHSGGGAQAATAAPSAPVASQVISYARAEIGCPYMWGGTGPCGAGYDCSGLAMQAYASAGITIPRTSQEQWAAGPQVSTPAPGDLVFFAGGDGTWSNPGHVGIVIDPAKHLMIDAYVGSLPVEYDTYGLPSSAQGLSNPVGFTDPAANGGTG